MQYCGFHDVTIQDFMNRVPRKDTSEVVEPEVTVQRRVICHVPMKHVQVSDD